MPESRKKINWKQIAILQAAVFVYSFISMLSKCASSLLKAHGLFSWQVILAGFGIVLALAVYAFFWQKILKKTELSVAYSNKAAGLLWSLVWSVFLFGEKITVYNVIGLVIIVIGVMLITVQEEEKK